MFENEIAAGAALLDKNFGKDWRDKIDLDKLDLRRYDCCVLGQLYGDFLEGLEVLNDFECGLWVAESWIYSHGFSSTTSCENPNADLLTREWIAYIERTRK